MVEHIVIIGLIVGAGYWIISPLLKSDHLNSSLTSESDERFKQLTSEKEGAYATIKELEFDLEMGKLSTEDYETLKGQYMLEALDCMKEIDALQSNQSRKESLTEKDIEDEIEQEVSQLRNNRSKKTDGVFCTHCGTKASSEDRFCSKCGTRIS
jgi:hypothetical protein